MPHRGDGWQPPEDLILSPTQKQGLHEAPQCRALLVDLSLVGRLQVRESKLLPAAKKAGAHEVE